MASFPVVLPHYRINLTKSGSWVIPSAGQLDLHNQTAVCTSLNERTPPYIRVLVIAQDTQHHQCFQWIYLILGQFHLLPSPQLVPPRDFQRNITLLRAHPDPTLSLFAGDRSFLLHWVIGAGWSAHSIYWLSPPRCSIPLCFCLPFPPICENEMFFLLFKASFFTFTL